jgi:MFS family permease
MNIIGLNNGRLRRIGLLADTYFCCFLLILLNLSVMVCFLIQGAAVMTLAHYQHVVLLYLGTFAFGLTMGNIIMMQSLITAECFGPVSFATVSGLAGVFTMSGAAFGPTIAGFIFDATQSYRTAFTIFAAMSAIAIIVIYFARPPEPDKPEPKAFN